MIVEAALRKAGLLHQRGKTDSVDAPRTMAVLHYVDGMTLEQVARECGMSVSGVRKRLRGLRSELRVMEAS